MNRIHTKQSLFEDLLNSGINPCGTLLVHSSMRAVGACENRGDTVLDALIEFMKDGLLIFPAHTWRTIGERNNIYDPETEPACVGILPNLFLKRPGVIRSLHPTHSVAAIGKDAAEYTAGEELTSTPCSRSGCYGKLYDRKAQILFWGCSSARNTLLHGVEEWNNIPGRFAYKPLNLFIKKGDSLYPYLLYRYVPMDISVNYIKMEPAFISTGIGRYCKIGDARSVLCDAAGMADLAGLYLKKEPDFFGNNRPVKENIIACKKPGMEKAEKKIMSKKIFRDYAALGLPGFTVLPNYAENGVRIAPSDRVTLGFIGLGRQSLSDFSGFAACPGVQFAACCDVDSIKVERFRQRVKAWQKNMNAPQRCDGYAYYEEMLGRKDIDAVVILTPDHWHALQSIHACEAGKDVFCQKPLAFTITEGLSTVKAVRRYKRVLQVGSQHRSSPEFQKAVELVRSGAIGHVEKIHVRVGEPPIPFNLPEQPVPPNLDFNRWVGPLNDPKIHYHPSLCPPISLNPMQNETLWGAWRWYRETGNGYTSDFGAHMFDIAQAAIGMDGSGPVEYCPKGVNGAQHTTMKYANGIVMTEQPYIEEAPEAQGIKFFGTKGWIEVGRGYLGCSDASKISPEIAGYRPINPAAHQKDRTLTAIQLSQLREQNRIVELRFEICIPHMQNFIDCVRSRENPVAPVEAGAGTNTLCCLANIANELNRTVKWDPVTLSFVKDKEAEAHRLYMYKYRKPYSCPL